MITSTSNPRVKFVRKLRSRRERDFTGLCYVEGLRPVAEAIQTDQIIERLVISPAVLTSSFGQSLVESQRARGIPVLEVSEEVFKKISQREGPQGIAAVVRQRWAGLGDLHSLAGLWIGLVGIKDPGNLGTIMRTVDAVGGEGIILLEDTVDPYDLTAIRASMGAVFSLRLFRAVFDDLFNWISSQSLMVVGTSDSAEMDYQDCRYPESVLLLMGSEQEGLPEKYLSLCQFMVSIPMTGRCDSLNLAVATGVMLYEIFSQHRKKKI